VSIVVKVDACTGCETCVESCPFDAIVMKEGKAYINEYCNACMTCLSVCPEGAIIEVKETVPAGDKKEREAKLQAYKGVFIFAEQREGKVVPVSYELLGAGRRLADERGTDLSAVLFGAAESEATELIRWGADRVFHCAHPELNRFNDDTYAEVLARIINEQKPAIVLAGATPVGRSFIPRVAARIRTGLTADCTSLEVDKETGNLLQIRPAFGGNIMATILCPDYRPQMATVRPNVMKKPVPSAERNALYELEGPAITRFACEVCHNVGKPHEDESVGQCQKCHLRHEFSLEQARKPETCNQCHIGPDHPQWEIYQESPHGIAYMTGGDRWNWEAEPGTLTVNDFPAPTCATCHLSGFGATGTTHDVGDRLTWFLFAKISERRPGWQDNAVRMQSVCQECHNTNWIKDFYEDADVATEAVNDWVEDSNEIMTPLRENDLLTAEPFDEPIDFVDFDLWHHWGRTTKFGAWMQGPDYSQWHGAYEVLRDLAELRTMATEKMGAAGLMEE